MEDTFDTLVLSGGGIKGFSILGGLQCAYDLGYLKNIKKYIGTSIGSVISYLIIIGFSPIEIVMELVQKKWLEKISQLNLVDAMNGLGACSYSPVYEALEKMTLDKCGRLFNMKDLKDQFGKELYCVTYNMTNCVTEYISSLNYPNIPCITAIRMSSNIPIVFERFKYNNCYYIDGGISDNFSINKGCEIGERVFGINLGIDKNELKDNPSEGMIKYILKIIRIAYSQKEVNYDIKHIVCNIMNNLKSPIDFNITLKEKLDLFSMGYTSVKNRITI